MNTNQTPYSVLRLLLLMGSSFGTSGKDEALQIRPATSERHMHTYPERLHCEGASP